MIVSFGSHQDDYLYKSIQTLKEIEGCVFDFVLFCTHNEHNWDTQNIETCKYSDSIGFDLAIQPYNYMKQNSDKLRAYDYIMYTENDILYTAENIQMFIKHNSILQRYNACCGFIRYEVMDDKKYILDFTSKVVENKLVEDVEYIITQQNVHSGCWILSYEQLVPLLDEVQRIGGSLEDRASNVYYSNRWPGSLWGIEKLIPKCELNSLLVHHMPNKYVVDFNTPHGKINVDDFVYEN